jgi:hypothetical protein
MWDPGIGAFAAFGEEEPGSPGVGFPRRRHDPRGIPPTDRAGRMMMMVVVVMMMLMMTMLMMTMLVIGHHIRQSSAKLPSLSHHPSCPTYMFA